MTSPRLLRKKLPNSEMLCRGFGSAPSTARYQNRIWNSTGTLRIASTYPPEIRDNSQFGDNRPNATRNPIRVAKKMPMTETRSVLSRPTKNTRV